MDEASLFTILKTTGLPVAYHHFVAPPPPPYLVYLFTASNNFGADNKVYSKAEGYQVELYTIKKDPASEQLVESALEVAEIYYDKSELFIDSENLYKVTYEIEV